jgi:hypothetical protein
VNFVLLPGRVITVVVVVVGERTLVGFAVGFEVGFEERPAGGLAPAGGVAPADGLADGAESVPEVEAVAADVVLRATSWLAGVLLSALTPEAAVGAHAATTSATPNRRA